MAEASILDPTTIERLGRESGGTGFAVVDSAGGRLLYLSPAAEGLRAALAQPDGAIRADLPALGRLRALAAGAAPRDEPRPERLRLGRLAPPIPCRCRLASLDGGEDVLLLAFDANPPAAPEKHLPAALPAPLAAPAQDPADAAATAGIAAFLSKGALPPPAVGAGEPAPPPPPGPPSEDSWFASIRDLVTETLSSARSALKPHEVLPPSPTALESPTPGTPPEREAPREAEIAEATAEPEAGAPEEPAEAAAPQPPAPAEEPARLGAGAIPEAMPSEEAVAAAAEGEPALDAEEPAHEEPDPAPRPAAASPLLPEPPAPPPLQGRSAAPGLTSAERSAFREIARALGARFADDPMPAAPPPRVPAAPAPPAPSPAPPKAQNSANAVLDAVPAGVIVHRGDEILFANRLLLDLVSFDAVGQIAAEGGMKRLFRSGPAPVETGPGGAPAVLATRRNYNLAVVVSSGPATWDGAPATLMLIRQEEAADPSPDLRRAEAEAASAAGRARELEAILDTATDGVLVLDENARILSLNRSAEALFGYDQREVEGEPLTALLAPESHRPALDYLDGLRAAGVASLLNDGREVLGRVRQGAAIPLFMTLGTIGDGPPRRFCAVLRDITAFKTAESELVSAKRAAEEASAQKSDLLAKISHEIRTPLSAIIGFAEVMIEERFGPIGNERYKDYLKDVHASGAHVISLVNDLLDLAKIEAGRMDLTFARVSLNEVVAATVTLLQPQAARDRIVMRTSFAPRLPTVFADERSIRQIVLNLVSNAIKFTDAGGQVIVSTAPTDRGEVAFRVRDTGIGMNAGEIEQALEPFRQVATARKRGGTGLGLPLTKALVEANRGALHITSNPSEGTLVEVLFPPARVLAE